MPILATTHAGGMELERYDMFDTGFVMSSNDVKGIFVSGIVQRYRWEFIDNGLRL